MLTGDTVLEVDDACTIRRQEEQYLIYNPHSDEMHLVYPWGHYLIQLCDGLRTVSEIERLLAAGCDHTRAMLKPQVRKFFAGLLDKGVLVKEGPGRSIQARMVEPSFPTGEIQIGHEPRR